MILVGVSLAVQTNLSFAKQSENVSRAFWKLREAQGVPLKMKSHELTFSRNFCANNDPWESGDISLIVGKMEASMGQSILKKLRKVSEDFRSLIA